MKKILLQTTLLLLAAAAHDARADTTNIQAVPYHLSANTNAPCLGNSTGYAYMTNSAGTMWLKPPANTVSGTFTDLSGYALAIRVTRQLPVYSWCDTNAVTFTATSANNYELYIYMNNAGLTNGQLLTVQVVWH
jgi:hypothetical protein